MTTYVDATGITVDGVPLNTLAKAVETKSGRMKVAPSRGANGVVAGRSGSIWTPGKPFDEGRFVLPMYVLGCDDDGLIPGGSTALKEFYKNKDLLQRLFSKRYDLLDVRQTQADGTVRQCYAECTAEVDFEMFNEQDARVNYELTIPSVYWRDNADSNQTTTGLATGGSVVSPLDGGTAPIDDLDILVKATAGTLSNPRITDVLTGWYVQWNGNSVNGTATEEVYFNNSQWGVRVGSAGLGFNPAGGSNGIGATLRAGSPSRLLTVTPHPVTGALNLRIDFTGGGTASVIVQGRRKYHS